MDNDSERARVLTCVYCGMEYPQSTPAWGDQVLTEHIKVCEKHPLRLSEEKVKKLQNALFSVFETNDVEELKQIRSEASMICRDYGEMKKFVEVIDALLETME